MTNSGEQQLIDRMVELESENQALRARIAELEQQAAKLLTAPIATLKTTETVPKFAKPKRQKRRRKESGHTGSYRHRIFHGEKADRISIGIFYPLRYSLS